MSGSAFLSIANHVSKLLGLPTCGKPAANGTGGYACTFAQAAENVATYGYTARWAPLASFLCIAFLLLWRRVWPRLLPGRWGLIGNAGPLFLLIFTAAAAYAMPARFAAANIPLVGKLASGLPAVQWPATPGGPTSSTDIANLISAAIPCALVGYMESLSIATTVARRHGPYDIEPTTEMTAVGVANMAVGLLSGFPVTGSFSRTAVNAASGSRSGLASMLSSLWILVIILTLMPALSYVPNLALSSVIAVALARLVEPATAIRYWRTDPTEFVVYAATFLVSIFVTVPFGILAGLVSSLLFNVARRCVLDAH